MPALGHTVTEATIQADHDALPPDEFARAYLNRRAASGVAIITPEQWARACDHSSTLSGIPCFSVDITPNRAFATIAVAGWRPDDRAHLEIVEHRPALTGSSSVSQSWTHAGTLGRSSSTGLRQRRAARRPRSDRRAHRDDLDEGLLRSVRAALRCGGGRRRRRAPHRAS